MIAAWKVNQVAINDVTNVITLSDYLSANQKGGLRANV